VWLVPCAASTFLSFDTVARKYFVPSSFMALSGGCSYCGGVFDGSRVWFAPGSNAQLVYVNVATRSVSLGLPFPSTLQLGDVGFHGAVFDGASVWLVPFAASGVVQIDVATRSYKIHDAPWASNVTTLDRKFSAGAIVQDALWLVQTNAPNTYVATGWLLPPLPSRTRTRTVTQLSATASSSEVWSPSTSHSRQGTLSSTSSATITVTVTVTLTRTLTGTPPHSHHRVHRSHSASKSWSPSAKVSPSLSDRNTDSQSHTPTTVRSTSVTVSSSRNSSATVRPTTWAPKAKNLTRTPRLVLRVSHSRTATLQLTLFARKAVTSVTQTFEHRLPSRTVRHQPRNSSRSITSTYIVTATGSITVSLGLQAVPRNRTLSVVAPQIQPAQRVLMADAATTTTAVASGTVAVTGATAGAAAALQVSRVIAVLSLARRCSDGVDRVPYLGAEPLEFPDSLVPPIRVGSTSLQYLRGAVAVNPLIMPIILLVGFVGGVVWIAVRPPKDNALAFPTAQLQVARLPGSIVPAGAIGVSGIATAAMALILGGDDGADGAFVAYAVVVLIVVAGLAFGFVRWLVVANGGPPRLAYVPVTLRRVADGSVPPISTTFMGAVFHHYVVEHHAWMPLNSNSNNNADAIVERYGWVLRAFRGVDPFRRSDDAGFAAKYLCPWWFLVEMTLTVAVAGSKGIAVRSCAAATIASLAANALALIAVVLVRPYTLTIKNGLSIATNFLTLGASVASLKVVQSSDTAAVWLATTAALISVAPIALAAWRHIMLRLVWQAALVIDDAEMVKRRMLAEVAGGAHLHFGFDKTPDHAAQSDDDLLAQLLADAEPVEEGTDLPPSTMIDRAFWDGASNRVVWRTEEGQQLYDEIDAMLNGEAPTRRPLTADTPDGGLLGLL
jgi:hypothetical protein